VASWLADGVLEAYSTKVTAFAIFGAQYASGVVGEPGKQFSGHAKHLAFWGW
jgi:hypothetical protein